jgi:hypothetical protein
MVAERTHATDWLFYARDVSEADTSAAREDELPAFRSAAHALAAG